MVRWEDIRDDLLDAVMQVCPAFTREQQDQIVTILNERGHAVTWNAMRYVGLSPVLSLLSVSIPPSHKKANAWGNGQVSALSSSTTRQLPALLLLHHHHPTFTCLPHRHHNRLNTTFATPDNFGRHGCQIQDVGCGHQ